MNKEIKKKWVEALRSGEYSQGRNALRSNTENDGVYKHCCLGVLCDIYNKETDKGRWEIDNYFTVPGDTSRTKLPIDVLKWSEMNSYLGYFPNDTEGKIYQTKVVGKKKNEETGELEDYEAEVCSLANMNDVGVSFSEIAKFIEENF